MPWGNIIFGAIALILIGSAIYNIYKNKKSGKSACSCGGGCSSCGSTCSH